MPWAAFFRNRKGGQRIFEQAELVALLLREQSMDNPDQVDMEAIKDMAEAESVTIAAPAA